MLQWSSHCIVPHNKDPAKALKLKTLTLLIKHGNDEEFTKKFSAEFLSTTLKACLTCSNNEERVTGLECLTECMRAFPSWFGHHKENVEKYLISCLESTCARVVGAAAVAFTCFLETGPAGISGINYVNNFRCSLKKVCATIQALYDNFFRGLSALGDSVSADQDILPIVPSIDNLDQHEFENSTAGRIMNCLILLKTLLRQQFSVQKQVFPKDLIDVILKGLSAYYCFSEDTSNRPGLLKRVQLHLFDVFRTLVKGFHTSLISFSVIFENGLLKIFQKIAKCNCPIHDTRYKASAYKTLAHWLSLSRVINEAQFQEKILPIILEDISSSQKAVLLSVDLPDTRKRKHSQNSSFSAMNSETDVFMERCCVYALDALKHLLSASLTIDRPRLEEILSLITRTLSDILNNKVCAPYTNEKCQIKLFEVFVSFVKREDMNILPSLHLMTYILKLGINSRNSSISNISMNGLDLLEKISHSTCPTLNLSGSRSMIYQSVDVLQDEPKKQKTSHKSEKDIRIISDIIITGQKDIQVPVTNPDLPQVVQLEDEEMTESFANEERERTSPATIINDTPVGNADAANIEDTPVGSADATNIDDTPELNVDLEDMFGSFQNVTQE